MKLNTIISKRSFTSMQQFIKILKRDSSRKFTPAIISDVDGVLVRGQCPIEGTLEALRKIKSHKIPFACLTNGGGQLESSRAAKLNSIFGENHFLGELMFMNHTPLKPKLIEFSKKNGILLVTGSLNVEEVLYDLKISNYVTADEIFALLCEQQQHYSDIRVDQQKYQNGKQTIQKRLNNRFNRNILGQDYGQWSQKINSIFAINDVSPYQTTLEVIHNILLNKKNNAASYPPYFASQNDIVWAGGYHRPRLAFGPFNYLLEEHCQRHGFDLRTTYFGKPERIAFKFVEDTMKEKFGTNFHFMIGDNPRADICGANRIGWSSFLTQTGVHQGANNDTDNPATFVVKNFQEAVDIILNINRKLSE